jgi:hypothetical protein
MDGAVGASAKRQQNSVTHQPKRLARPRHLETETETCLVPDRCAVTVLYRRMPQTYGSHELQS